MSRFFELSGGVEVFEPEPLTFVYSVDDDGNVCQKCIELSDNPLKALTFNDFQLSELLKHGISYNALNITPDMRLGNEKSLDALIKRFDSLSKEMFVQPKSE